MSLNRVQLLGNVCKDPEIRQAGDAKVASFSLATSEKYKDRSGNEHENTDFHNIVCWRNHAGLCEKYVHKGDKLYIEGKLTTRSYDSNGEKKYVTEVVVSKIEFCGNKQNSNNGGGATQEPDGLGGADDIPFR